MKILFFIESLRSGGKERRLVELLTGLKKHPDIHCELVLTRSQIHYKEIYDLSIPIHIIERKGLKKDPSLFFQFYKLAKNIKPDIIHVWGNLAAIYTIPTKIFLRIPMINNQIADAPLILPRRVLSYKLTFPFSDVLLANSKAGILAYKPPQEKSVVIYNGFDFNRIKNLRNIDELRNEFKITSKFIVGMVANFSVRKDYKSYIRSALLVLQKIEDVTFLCVGSGDQSDYQKMVPDKFKKKILFLEAQEDILSLMNICDVGVLSTYTEGISNSIMEFMALAKPVVATDGGGTKELISDEVTGYLVQRESELEIAEKIKELLNNEILRNKMGQNGKDRIHEKFNINSMINEFVKIYNQYHISK